MDTLNLCKRSVGYSIHSLNQDINYQIMRRKDLPDWDYILSNTDRSRVAVVVNRYNIDEFEDIVRYVSKFDQVSYIQARRISTDTRKDSLELDAHLYEELHSYIRNKYPYIGNFYNAERYLMFGKEVCFWRTVKTTIDSYNYFTDGTISKSYFVIEGYLQNVCSTCSSIT